MAAKEAEEAEKARLAEMAEKEAEEAEKARLAEMAAQEEERGETALDDSHWISCAEREAEGRTRTPASILCVRHSVGELVSGLVG
jgi:hypothetical protein